MRAQTYPDGRTASTCYDYAGRPIWASAEVDLTTNNSRCTGGTPPTGAETFYVRGVGYHDHGGVERQELGNNLHEFTRYNNRLQPEDVRLGTTADGSDRWRAELSYDQLGGSCLNQNGGKNNGNIWWQRITAPKDAGGSLTLCQAYGYDAFNRLTTSLETVVGGAQSWSRTNSYDPFGNRTVDSGIAAQTIEQTTNRITGVAGMSTPGYDNAGNMTFHPLIGTLTYDAENRQTSFADSGKGGTYVYDGDGNRIKRVSTGMGGETAFYVYDAFGRLAAEYAETAPAGAARTEFRTTDHLGSTRVVTDSTQAIVSRRDFYPFGERINDTVGDRDMVLGYALNPMLPQRFTGKERDDESNLDYFLARYYASSLGRFNSVDPAGAGVRANDPQSWNAYSYVSNAPLAFVDLDGSQKRVPNVSVEAAIDVLDPASKVVTVNARVGAGVRFERGAASFKVGGGMDIGVETAFPLLRPDLMSTRPTVKSNLELKALGAEISVSNNEIVDLSSFTFGDPRLNATVAVPGVSSQSISPVSQNITIVAAGQNVLGPVTASGSVSVNTKEAKKFIEAIPAALEELKNNFNQVMVGFADMLVLMSQQ